MRCPRCDRLNPVGSRFCNGCGTALLTGGTPSSSAEPHPPSPIAQPPAGAGTGTLPPQTVLSGRYIILKRVGRGGMGAVYQAADIRIPGKMWAIKEMSDTAITNPLEKKQAIDAFRQEALMLARLDHVNLPKVTDHFTEGGKQYLVMDFIDGETLDARLQQANGGPLPVDEVQNWAKQLCDVLGYLHNRTPPIIFRDLKPGNVMVTPEGTIKLIDFGIARLFKPGKATDTAFFGTAGYAPREQYGKEQTDARSDIYALGATLYHLLTGVSPTDHPFGFEDIRKLNSQVPDAVSEAIMKAVSQDPEDRWQSTAEMGKALAKPPSQAKPAGTQQPKQRPKVSPVSQPAAAAAAAKPQPIQPSAPYRLTFWSGLGLVLLGATLHGVTAWLSADELWEYTDFPAALFAFIPALFGVLFGPWIGGFAGVLGSLTWDMLAEEFWAASWGVAVGAFALGALPGLIVKDARNWKAVLGAGILASGAYALGGPVAIGILEDWWYDLWYIAGRVLAAALPPNVLLLPLLARWLVGPIRRWGLYWRDAP